MLVHILNRFLGHSTSNRYKADSEASYERSRANDFEQRAAQHLHDSHSSHVEDHETRNAMWYYYSSIANMGLGNNLVAVDHAKQAAAMEPNNMEYVNYANQLQFRGQRYQNTGYGYGRPSYGTGNLCCDLWCADTLCECMGGDLCSCM